MLRRAYIILFFCIGFFFYTKSFGQETKWNGFMSLNTIYDHEEQNVHFNLGQVVTFVTSDITDDISILNENTFGQGHHGHAEEAEFTATVERAIIRYQIKDFVFLAVGKFHTPISNWNIVYHHGVVLTPSASLPAIFSRRIIERHTTGMMLGGDFIGKFNFGYRFLVGNGIGATPFEDDDKNKSLSMNVHAYPVEDFQITLSAYFDRLQEGVDAPNGDHLHHAVDQSIYAVSLNYEPVSKPIEFFSEFYMVKNQSGHGHAHWNPAGFAHLGYSIKKWTPYYRYDLIRVDAEDEYFTPGDADIHTLGLRLTFNYLANIRFEYQHTNDELGQRHNTTLLQFAIGF